MRCAVLGSPIEHSLSPVLHRAAYAQLGLDWSYEAIEVDEGTLAGFLGGLDDTWRGLSLTMPLKRTVVPLLDEADEWNALSGGANTVLLEGRRRRGANTDVPGAVAALRERGVAPASAVVLGGGATATSVLLALAELGCRESTLVVREPQRAGTTVEALTKAGHPPRVQRLDQPWEDADLVVSTVPPAAQTTQLVDRAVRSDAVFEVVYDPWPTPLARAATHAGRRLVSGLDLLAHQAVLQVELMTGGTVSVDLLRAAGWAVLPGVD